MRQLSADISVSKACFSKLCYIRRFLLKLLSLKPCFDWLAGLGSKEATLDASGAVHPAQITINHRLGRFARALACPASAYPGPGRGVEATSNHCEHLQIL